jgi:hypothetical protein
MSNANKDQDGSRHRFKEKSSAAAARDREGNFNCPPFFDSNGGDLSNVEFTCGSKLCLQVKVLGANPMKFEWFKDGQTIFHFRHAKMEVPEAFPGDGGSYFVVVSNRYGSVTSRTAEVTYNYGIYSLVFKYMHGEKHIDGENHIVDESASDQAKFTVAREYVKSQAIAYAAVSIFFVILVFGFPVPNPKADSVGILYWAVYEPVIIVFVGIWLDLNLLLLMPQYPRPFSRRLAGYTFYLFVVGVTNGMVCWFYKYPNPYIIIFGPIWSVVYCRILFKSFVTSEETLSDEFWLRFKSWLMNVVNVVVFFNVSAVILWCLAFTKNDLFQSALLVVYPALKFVFKRSASRNAKITWLGLTPETSLPIHQQMRFNERMTLNLVYFEYVSAMTFGLAMPSVSSWSVFIVSLFSGALLSYVGILTFTLANKRKNAQNREEPEQKPEEEKTANCRHGRIQVYRRI